MAKSKNQVELIRMSKCLQSLNELNERLSGLFNILPECIQYIKSTPSGNKEHQEFLVKIVEDHYNKVIECYRAE